MITDEGRTYIKRYLAGNVPSIAQAIAVGIGESTPTALDAQLQFEVSRSDVSLTGYDFVNERLVFKAPVPEDFGGQVYEVALFSKTFNDVAGEFDSRLITTFDSGTENWIDPTSQADSAFTTSNVRVGDDMLRQTAPASGSKTDALQELFLDFSGHSGADKFVFAFNVLNANVSSVQFRFMTDSANYYDISVSIPSSGYKIVEATKSSAVATGTPDWANITEIRVTSNMKSSGTGWIDFDAIRINDVDTINPEYVMISREVLAVPFNKEEGKIQDIEFTLDVNI